jgi:hypothetical protein
VGTSTTTTTGQPAPTTPTPANVVGMPTARSPFVQPAPGQPVQSSAQAQGQATGR